MKKRFISLLLSLSMLVSIIPTTLADEIEPDNSVQNNENRVEATKTASVETLSPDETNEVSETTSEPIETAFPSVEAETPEATPTESVTASDDDSIEEIDTSIQLTATGTYYPEYGFYFDEASGTITDTDKDISGTLNIPEKISGSEVKQIGYQAFSECTSLTRVNIPKTVTSIDSYAFQDCTNLSYVTLNYNNAREFTCKINSYAFKGCSNLKELILPDSVTSLGREIIAQTGIESITIPKSIKEGDYGILADCPSLSTVILEEGMTWIPYGLCCSDYFDNNHINKVVVPDSVTDIGDYAFKKCVDLKEINIPKSVKNIGQAAFEDCTSLASVELKYNNAREFTCKINSYAFRGCSNLKELILPDSVTSLGREIIAQTGIESITIPKSIKEGDYGVLADCPSLSTVILEEGITWVPYGLCCNDYFNNSYIDTVVIPDTVTEIGDNAFRKCVELKEINMPASLERIGQCAFQDCVGLTSVNIPKTVNTIEYNAFYNCSKLSNIIFNYNEDENFTLQIGSYAFTNCSNLKQLILPEKLTTLGTECIRGTAISSITIPNTVTSAYRPFDGAIWLDNVYFANGIKKIPDTICANDSNNSYITKVEIPMSVTEIGYEAFENCIRLPQITIPEGVTSIGWEAFNNCPNLTVYCAESTPAITELIDNNINFSITKNISSYENLVYSNTHFVTDYSDVSTAGMVNLEVQYKFKDDVIERIKNPSVIIRLPEAVEVLNSTVKVNGVVSTDFENDNNILTIPVTEMSGTVSLCAEPTEQTRILSYALMSYNLDDSWDKQKDVIGVINQDIPILTVKADNVTASDKITVSGVAVP